MTVARPFEIPFRLLFLMVLFFLNLINEGTIPKMYLKLFSCNKKEGNGKKFHQKQFIVEQSHDCLFLGIQTTQAYNCVHVVHCNNIDSSTHDFLVI